MDSATTNGAVPHTNWRKWVVVGISGGATLAIVCALIVGVVVWFAARPPTWDTDALSVVWGKANTIYDFGDNGRDFHQAGYSLDFALQNNTNRDVTLPETATIMRRLTDGGVLDDYSTVAKRYKAAFIPARQKAQLSIKLDVGCTSQDEKGVVHDRDPGVCYRDTWAEMDALVLFDQNNHLQVILPKPVLKEFPPLEQKATPR